jgi:hypothetical protein
MGAKNERAGEVERKPAREDYIGRPAAGAESWVGTRAALLVLVGLRCFSFVSLS